MIASKEGVGAIRLNLAAGAALGASGVHQLFFRNDHLPELGVFLANALVPSTSEIKIGGQARDPLQRETRLSFHVAPADMGELDAVFRTEGATYRRRVKPNRRKSQSVAESVAAPRSS